MIAGASRPAVARGFDRLAPVYEAATRWLLADRVHRSQLRLLDQVLPFRCALLVGGGAGRFLVELLRSPGAGRVLNLDASCAMSKRARDAVERRAGRDALGHVEFRVGGLEALAADERFDRVFTHCFLDLFDDEELAGVVERLAAAMEPAGRWSFSDFAIAAGPAPLRAAQGALVGGLYAFFRASCGIGARRLPDFDAAFRRAGLKIVASSVLAGGLLRAAVLEAAVATARSPGRVARDTSFDDSATCTAWNERSPRRE